MNGSPTLENLMVMAYNEGFETIGKMYADKYLTHPEVVKGMLAKFHSVRNLLSEVYGVLRSQDKCEDMAALPEKEKRELWNEAKAWVGHEDRVVLHRVCKAIIVIGSLIK